MTNHQSPITLSLFPETHITGLIPSDKIWGRDSHYIITGDVTVPKGVTLTIEPGAWVRFDGYYKLKVEGRLNALGQPDNMITFTPLEKASYLSVHPVRCLLSNGAGIKGETNFGRDLKSFLYPVRNGISHGASFLTGFTSNQGLTSHFALPTSHLPKATWNRIEFDEAEDGREGVGLECEAMSL